MSYRRPFRILAMGAGLGMAYLISGCAVKAPRVTKGTFTTSYTVPMQRGRLDVRVLSRGPATYVLKQYWMDHPMGQRPDTEAEVVTPAGRFLISNRNLGTPGLTINGKLYLEPVGLVGRGVVQIDPQGAITVILPSPAPVTTPEAGTFPPGARVPQGPPSPGQSGYGGHVNP